MRDSPVLGAVLAGGRSSRMGTPKALVALRERPLISYPIAALVEAGIDPVVVAKPDSPLPPVEARVLREPDEPVHPLAGVVAALAEAGDRPVVALGCDMPLVPPPLLAWLAALDAPVAVPELAGRLQPLLARYRRDAAGTLGEALDRGESTTDAVLALEPRIVAEDEVARFGDPETIAFNVNTPEDLERAARLLDRGAD